MNNFTNRLLMSILISLLGCFSLFGQNLPIGFDIVKNVEKNQVDLVATEFQEVVGFQFGIKFDKTGLQYEGMDVPLQEISSGSIFANQVGNDILVVFVSANTAPVSLDAGTVVLSYKFGDDISDVYFCASDDEIILEGAIDVNGIPTATELYFSEYCNNPGPCVLVCNDEVNISIPNSGTLTLTETGMEDMFLEGNNCSSNKLLLSLYDTSDDLVNGNALDNMTFTIDDDGRTLIYEIKDIDTQNTCWGNVKLYHRMSGDLTPPADRDAKCGEEISVDGIADEGAPLFYVSEDNSPKGSFGVEDEIEEIGRYKNIEGVITGLSVYVVDTHGELDNCNLGTLNRAYHLIDADGSELQVAIQKIKIVPGEEFNASAVTFPIDITVECDIDPSVTGSPEVVELSCQLTANSYMDEVVNTDDGKKILRTWTVVDWCSGIVVTQTQIINSVCSDSNNDTESPVAICIGDLAVSLNDNGEAKIWASDIDFGSYDNDGPVTLLIKKVGDSDFAEYIILTEDNLGQYEVILQVTDAAGNFNTCWTNITVIENSGGADCLLVCNAEVLISIEQNQTIAINSAANHHFFLDAGTSCPDGVIVISLYDQDGNDVSSKIFTDLDHGYLGTYKAVDQNSLNSCFGTFSIEVKEDGLVWPGDTNNDGIVNNFDILNIGIGFEAEGPSRTDASINWEGQEANDWDHKFDNGLNFKFADADGLGSINFSDIEVIEQNWEEEHDFRGETDQSGFAGSDIPIFLQAGDYATNKVIEIPIHLGAENLPADNIYGIAFSISYDPSMVDVNSLTINTNDSWFTQNDNDHLRIEKNNSEDGLLHFAMVRKDHENLSGTGVIADLEVFFHEIDMEISESHLSIESVRFVDSKGKELPAVQIGSTVNIENQTTSTTANVNPLNISLYPNPSSGLINIETNSTIESINLMKLDGSICKTYKGDVRLIDLSHLENQLYLLKIQTNNETVVKKVTLLK